MRNGKGLVGHSVIAPPRLRRKGTRLRAVFCADANQGSALAPVRLQAPVFHAQRRQYLIPRQIKGYHIP